MAGPSRDGHLEKKEKRRDLHTETHTEMRQNRAHRVPVTVSEFVCVCVSGELCLSVYLSKLLACSGVCGEAKFSGTTQTYRPKEQGFVPSS